MGGKSATTTQTVQIPPEVMARYRAVNARAEQAAQQPFQAYSQDPNAFVAPLTQTQQAGIQNLGMAQNIAQPFFQTGAGLTLSGAQGVGPLTQQQIGYYQNPFTQAVVGATTAGLQQQQGQQLAQQQAEAIRSGAFGGDRAGLQRAQLMGQQGLATAQAIAPLYQRGYEQAVQTATGQQAVMGQDLQRRLAAGQQMGGLGSAATQSALQAGQALLGAGTAEQQTQQAGLSALYNQFLQERGYPFQVAQFLANIAMGTGALSGSTTTTQQPVPFFSDEREKTNIQPLGKGLYAYDYKDDVAAAERGERPMPPKRVGPMAQDIEEQAPGLVGEVGGRKVVKGLAPESMGGAVLDLAPNEYRENFADGGLAALYAQFGTPYGLQQGLHEGPYGGRAGYLKSGMSAPRGIMFKADTRQVKPISTIMQEAMRGADQASSIANMFDPQKSALARGVQSGLGAVRSAISGPSGPTIDETAVTQGTPDVTDPYRLPGAVSRASGGLVGYALGGSPDDDDSEDKSAAPIKAYDAPGADIDIPTGMPDIKKLPSPGQPPSASGLGAGSQLMQAAQLGSSLYSLGSAASSALPALLAFLPSDERLKSGMEQVGELYNGLPVYKYRMGDGPAQIGLSAQEAAGLHPGAVMEGPDGFLRLNYDRATRAYGGGLAPRRGYADGGNPDEDYAIRTIAAEASGRSPEEARAIAHVIQNRLASGRWGETYRDVVRAPKQFEPWSNPDSPNYPMRFSPDSPRYQMAREALGAARRGEDITGGALNFYAPAAQARLAETRGDRAPVPSWALNAEGAHRPYVDFGPTRIVREVDAPRASGLMAYAGQPSRGEAAGEIDRMAGEGRGLAGARTTAPVPTPSPQERGLLSKMLPTQFGTKTQARPEGKQFESWSDFLTSRQFVQPFLEGLAGMASSPSLFAGPAILQGLGAASRSYTGLERAQSELATAEEQRQLTGQQARTQIAEQISLLSNIPATNFIIALDKSGKPIASTTGEMYMSAAEFKKRLERGEINIDNLSDVRPASPSETKASDAIRRGDVSPPPKPDATAGATPGAAAAAPATPGAAAEAAKPAEQRRFRVSDNGIPVVIPDYERTDKAISEMPVIKQAIESQGGRINPIAIRGLVNTDRGLSAQNEEALKRFTRYQGGIEDVDRALVDAKKYITAFSALPETGAGARGRTIDQRANAIRIYDIVSRVFGGQGITPELEGTLSAKEILDKLRNQLSTSGATGPFKADDARQAVLNSLPGGEITEQAGLSLLATLITQTQRQKDFVNFLRNYQNRYGVLVGAEEAFSQQMGKTYDDMRNAIMKAYKVEEKTLPTGRKVRLNAVDAFKNGILSPEDFEKVTGGGFGFRRLVME